jgi:hypothetical protein
MLQRLLLVKLLQAVKLGCFMPLAATITVHLEPFIEFQVWMIAGSKF